MSNNQGKPAEKKSAPVQKKNNKEQLNMEEALSMSEAFVIKHKNLLIIIVSVIVVAVVGGMLYSHFVVQPRNQEAAEAMFPAENYFERQMFEAALNGDSIGHAGFLTIADEYSNTPSGNLAKAYAGISLAQMGKYDDALKYLKDFDADDQMIAPAVIGTMGDCYAGKGDLDQALKYFMEAAKKADNNTVSPNYLLEAGLIYEKQGNKAEALKVYTEIKDKYFASTQAADIDKYIERVK